MKTLVILFALGLTHAAIAQQPQTTRSFWVIEGNPQKQNFTTVRYYTPDRKLIGEEVIKKPWIDIRKKRNIRMLDRMLAAWKARDTTMKVTAVTKRKN